MESGIHLAIVTDTYPPEVNGVAHTLKRFADDLTERGHEVEVVRHTHARMDIGMRVPSLPLPGYDGVRIGLPRGRALRNKWRKNPPDIVYVATESPLGSSAMRAARALGIPVVSGYHTQFPQYAKRYRLGGLGKFISSYMKRLHNGGAATFAPSADIGADLEAEGYRNVRLLGRGVDSRRFHPSRRNPELRELWGAGKDAPVYIVVGRVAAEKNIPLAIRAFEEIKKKAPDAKLVVVGDGPKRAELEAVNPEVIWAGWRTGDELAEHYASADVFLFPSSTETFGNVVLEALASGLVTVTFKYAASARYIMHGRDGLQAALGDDEGFVAESLASLEHAATGSRLRKKARKVAKQVSWKKVISGFEGDLQEVIAQSQKRAEKPEPAPNSLSPAPSSPPPAGTPAGKGILRYRTVFISDVHLGTPDAKVDEVNDFLRRTRCEKLVLNGDIIDGWHMKRNIGNWTTAHTHFVRIVLAKIEKEGTEVIYLRGNHDDILERFLPVQIANLSIVSEHTHETPHGDYLVVHGDGFDQVTTNHRWVALAGAIGYEALLKVNRYNSKLRRLLGKPEFSLSKLVKAKVKSAVSFVGRYEETLQKFAQRRGCTGIICGHIHTPADKHLDGVHYLNSGDWVESLTAVVETLDRRLGVLSYEDFLAEAGPAQPQETEMTEEKTTDLLPS